MAPTAVPMTAEVRALRIRGSGAYLAATPGAADDPRLPAANATLIAARSAWRIGRGDLGQNRRNLAAPWGALGLRE